MPNPSLPEPSHAIPQNGRKTMAVSIRRHWRGALVVVLALLAAVVMAQAIIVRTHPAPVAAATIAGVTTMQAVIAPTPAPAGRVTDTATDETAPADARTPADSAAPATPTTPTAAAAAAAARMPTSTGLDWMLQELPCNTSDADATVAHGEIGRVASCTPAHVLALVNARSAGGTPTALAYSVQALATPQLAAHPRLLLDSTTLATLRQRAAANTPQWQALKAQCDSYIGGSVEYPSGNAYPNLPNLGQGYQGSSYVPALLAEGMCYQVLKTSNPTAAASYGAKAVDILMKMSTSGSQGQPPCTDSGYGIRFYGVGMGIGYDWVWDLLTSAQRTQVYTTANAWITAWEAPNGCADFEFAHPQSNYYAGYFHAKAAIALATYDENPSAPAEWTDWLTNQFAKRVQPYYQLHLLGGGWPEGYSNYAPLGILNMTLPIREVMTATGTDLVHATAPYSYPVDSGEYLMHFTWPSLTYFDDRDTNHAGSGSGSQPPGTTQVGLFQQLVGADTYWGSPHTAILRQYLALVNAATSGFGAADPWLQFLELDPAGTTAPLGGLPLSYFAPGLGAVAARSDWTTGASWMSFRAAPYANNPAQGEEYFDQGSLALVRGGTPLLLNATGWMVHDPNGTSDENLIYNDNYGSFSSSNLYSGNRQIYNVFYVRHMSNGTLAEQFGQYAATTEDNQASTKVAAYEDGSNYVYVLATGLQDMYRSFAAGPAVVNWAREVVFVRPELFVVYDRTTAGSASYDQYMAWHFPASPAIATNSTGGNRLDVTYNGAYAGEMTTVLPLNAGITTTAMYPTSNPTKAWQVQVRAPAATAAASQQWITVFDLAPSAAAATLAKPIMVGQGSIVGVQMTSSNGNAVVVSSAGAPGTPLSGTIAYTVDNRAARQVITDLAPSTGYTVSIVANGNQQTVTVTAGGTTMSSANGVLSFISTGSGNPPVQPAPPSSSTLLPPPVSDLPVPGYPRPYTG